MLCCNGNKLSQSVLFLDFGAVFVMRSPPWM
jgi:hypothetical protein